MTRIIAGIAGGSRIDAPPGASTRPTTDRVREALFSRLDHLDEIEDAVVLDLYAGSGALGLEAASRGAARVVLVESAPAVARVAARNAASLRLAGVDVVRARVERHLAGAAPAAAHLVFADPPYDLDDDELAGVLLRLVDGGWVAPGGLVVVERSKRSPEPAWPRGLTCENAKTYGETVLWFARAQEDATP